MTLSLCPAQQRAHAELHQALAVGNIIVLQGDAGTGRTTVLQALHQELPGVFLDMRHYLESLREHNPAALEETFEQLILDALARHDVVIVDDLRLLTNVLTSHQFYQRKRLLNAPLTTMTTLADETGKKLIFSFDGNPPDPIQERCHLAHLRGFEVEDYEFLCRAYLGESLAGSLDYRKIYRFAPQLNAHQLRAACQWLREHEKALDTEAFIQYLRAHRLFSNVDLGEVQQVELHDLQGVDDVIRSLEANIILPLENDELAAELDLKPKRGVLLAGPPGTGKTTVGRALAHRLRSKFFLLDGTFIAGTDDFYCRVRSLFEEAKRNAPSILFIDDSDVLFENREEFGPGLHRYLLTLLDGLESESAGRVCVMMTAMDVGALPPALVRSGRVELWLEMQLPNEFARAAILRQHLQKLPPALGTVDLERVVSATEGFTGADLKRLVEDGKALFGYDKVRREPLQPFTAYLLAAVDTVRANKQRYADAEARARQKRAGYAE